MPRAVWLADVLTDAGLKIRPYSGWETRGKTDFTPRGVILHHTVTSPTSLDATVDRMLAVRGSSTTPPPLCNYSTNRDGSVSIIAAGTANHGGQGEWKGLSGNRFFFGDEMKNLGTKAEPWSDRQLESARMAAAAILDHISADVTMVCSHAEYATPAGRKTDPHTLDMDKQRLLIAGLFHPLQEDDDMATAQEIWFHLISDPITGTQRGAQAILAFARQDAHTAKVNSAIAVELARNAVQGNTLSDVQVATIAAAVADGIAEEVADELASRLTD